MPQVERVALAGRVVTMDRALSVIDGGVVYVRDGVIAAVQPRTAPAPPGFTATTVVETGGSLFPGLIELHNHLPYDVLPLWSVPKLFTNRDQWAGTPGYHRMVTGPMTILGGDSELVPAVVRYVEVRCLLGGTTTSQGLTLAVDPGIASSFRGLVRNVEAPGDLGLPAAVTHIADVEAVDADKFLARISGHQKMLLHLSEGVEAAARDHFLALQIAADKWAITSNLIGIHCVGLTRPDFGVLASHGGSMVWSPLSNLLLYGQTARLGDALAEGVPVALGSDWAPSGSKNLLGELKVANLAAPLAGARLSAPDLVSMVTRTPAQLLGWDTRLGSLEPGKRADLIVVHGTDAADPYESLVAATEADLDLVVIDGVPRAGTPPLMAALGIAEGDGETVTVGADRRVLNLTQANADPRVQAITVADAVGRLTEALANLPAALNRPPAGRRGPTETLLAVDGVIDNGMSPRSHLPYHGRLTGSDLSSGWTDPAGRSDPAAPGPLPALTLDPLCAVDNPSYRQTLAHEPNLPGSIRDGLAALNPG